MKIFIVDNDIDTIVHFAAESHVDRSIVAPNMFVKTNIEGTQILLEVAKSVWLHKNKDISDRCRFHHVSTDEVYGSLSSVDLPSIETDSYNPSSPYAASKAAADHLVRAYHRTYSLPVSISNCSNNFGKNQHLEKLIPTVINSCILKKEIPVYGTGENIRDWVYVTDHVDGVIRILNSSCVGETYNIGGNNERTNITLITKICKIMDELIPINNSYSKLISFVEDRPGHDWRYALNVEKINNELNWQAKTKFNEKLFKTIEWYIDKLSA